MNVGNISASIDLRQYQSYLNQIRYGAQASSSLSSIYLQLKKYGVKLKVKLNLFTFHDKIKENLSSSELAPTCSYADESAWQGGKSA